MSLVKYSPLVSRMLQQWPDFWDDDFSRLVPLSHQSGLEVYETEKTVVVKANVAGVTQDDIELTFEKGVLFITAEAKQEENDEQKKHYSHSSWSYSYKVYVPGEIDQDQEPTAELTQGILHVTFRKRAKAEPKRLKVTTK